MRKERVCAVQDNGQREWLWSKKIQSHLVMLDNIPLDPLFSFGDLVEIDPESKEITKIVLPSLYRTERLVYDDEGTKEEAFKKYKSIRNYLEDLGIVVENTPARDGPSLTLIAIPHCVSNQDLIRILLNAPVHAVAVNYNYGK